MEEVEAWSGPPQSPAHWHLAVSQGAAWAGQSRWLATQPSGRGTGDGLRIFWSKETLKCSFGEKEPEKLFLPSLVFLPARHGHSVLLGD